MRAPEFEYIYAVPVKDIDPEVDLGIRGMLNVFDHSGDNTAAIAAAARLFTLPRNSEADVLELRSVFVYMTRLVDPRIPHFPAASSAMDVSKR